MFESSNWPFISINNSHSHNNDKMILCAGSGCAIEHLQQTRCILIQYGTNINGAPQIDAIYVYK